MAQGLCGRRSVVGAIVTGILLAGWVGCQKPAPEPVTVASYTPLADLNAQTPQGVTLPPGFYPLVGHYNTANPNDHYNGWPRYIVSNTDSMIMCYVPTQTITMGGGLGLDEVPARPVLVNHFYIDLHEVSNQQFHAFDLVTKADKRDADPADRYREYYVEGHNDHHPVRNVTWHEAYAYAAWTGKLLPTEAQWEAAARGDDERIYPWGSEEVNEVSRYLCNCRTGRDDYDGYENTAPVLAYAPGVSPYGVYNMSGNVWEWCADWYDPGRYGYPSQFDPAVMMERGPKDFGDKNYPNPLSKAIAESRVGPLRGGQRAIRGGSFTNSIRKCRVDTRAPAEAGTYQHNVGFRCVLPLPPESGHEPARPVPATTHSEPMSQAETVRGPEFPTRLPCDQEPHRRQGR
jgi:formylglycine-generating enzyme required for sulfatase activity